MADLNSPKDSLKSITGTGIPFHKAQTSWKQETNQKIFPTNKICQLTKHSAFCDSAQDLFIQVKAWSISTSPKTPPTRKSTEKTQKIHKI